MRILVAGGAGYLGSRLVPDLVEHGYDVTVVDLCWFGNHLPESVPVVRKDLFDCGPSDFDGHDQVIFLAGLSNDPMAEYSPARNFILNAALPGFVAFAAKQAGVRRMIYASSCSVYGYASDRLYDETAPVTCSYPYGISKLQGERAVLQLQDETFSTLALRQGTICGYSPRMRFDLIVNAMFKTAMRQRTVIVNNPSIWRPILDIRDAVAAYRRAIQANDGISGVFNVASCNSTVGQVADHVKDAVEALTGEPVRFDLRHQPDLRNYKVGIEKARVELGFEPQHSVKDIVYDLASRREAYGDYEEDAFYNIRVFRTLSERSPAPVLSLLPPEGEGDGRADRAQGPCAA
jgi:nucleoside-diphosphate-sugar epimerase